MISENNNKTEMDETARQRLQQAASGFMYNAIYTCANL